MEVTLESRLKPLRLNGHVEMQEFLTDDQSIFIVRPYQNFGNILQVMESRRIKLLSECEIRNFVKPIIKALMAIHQVGFLHGDVRPKKFSCIRAETTRAQLSALLETMKDAAVLKRSSCKHHTVRPTNAESCTYRQRQSRHRSGEVHRQVMFGP